MMDILYFFGISCFYNIAYFFVSTKVDQGLPYILFMILISLVYSVFFYQWTLRVWHKQHKVELKEGFCVMGSQLFLIGMVSLVLRILNAHVNTVLFQGICALFLFLWIPLSYAFYYRLACQNWKKKKIDWIQILFGILLMGVFIAGDTLFKSVFVWGNFYGACTALAYSSNPWFGSFMSISIALIFQQSFGKMLVSSLLFLVLGFVYALLMRAYLLMIQKRGIKNGINEA